MSCRNIAQLAAESFNNPHPTKAVRTFAANCRPKSQSSLDSVAKSGPMYSRHSRRKSNHCALYHIALGLTMIAVCVSADAENAATLDDTARVLAGLPVTAQLASSTQTGGWQAHAAAMDKAWKTKDYFQLGPIAS